MRDERRMGEGGRVSGSEGWEREVGREGGKVGGGERE